jgi:hypothetical protein
VQQRSDGRALFGITPPKSDRRGQRFGHPQKIGADVFYRGDPEKPRLTKVFAHGDEPSAECSPASYPAKNTEVAAR